MELDTRTVASSATWSAARARRFALRGDALVLAVATTAFSAVMVAGSLIHYHALRYARFDLGNMTQAVWSTAHGRLLEITSLNGTQMSRLGSHADPFLALLTPFWLAWPDPQMLLVLQGLAVAAGTIPIYLLGRKHLGSDRAALHISLAYLVYPATQYNAFTPGAGFHPVTLAIPLLLAAIWFIDEGRLLPFAVCGLLAALTKEEIGAAVGLLGLWYGFRHGRRLVGGLILGCGLAASALNFFLVIPAFAPAGHHPFAGRYAEVGGSPRGIIHTLLTDPSAAVHEVATGHKLLYLVALTVPFLGLWLRVPLLAIAAAPDLLINLLSSKPEQTTLQFQYTAGILPFIIAASIVALSRTRHDAFRVSLFVLAICTVMGILNTPLFQVPTGLQALRHPTQAQLAREHALQLVPADAPLSATNVLGAQLSERRYIYVFPTVRRADWVIADTSDETAVPTAQNRKALGRLERRGWTRVFSRAGVVVLHRG